MNALKVSQLSKHYGGLDALTDVNLIARTGERRAIIGPNGAGKTTLLNIITGEVTPTEGTICLGDRDVTDLSVHKRVNLGMAYTSQSNNLFDSLNVLENVCLAVQQHLGIFRQLLRFSGAVEEVVDSAVGLLDLVGLAAVQKQRTSTLSYGQQRTLEVALALATEPKILLLDEPTAGMSPAETEEMVELISKLPRLLTLFIVEHDMDVVFRLADQITVLHYGKVVTEGTPNKVRANRMVQEKYLGQYKS